MCVCVCVCVCVRERERERERELCAYTHGFTYLSYIPLQFVSQSKTNPPAPEKSFRVYPLLPC